MTDPLSAIAALGVAANVFQLVEYSLNIVSKASQLRQSLDGSLPENQHRQIVTENFYVASATLSTFLEECKSSDKTLSEDDELLQQISRSCEAIAGELLAELDRLKVSFNKHTKWKSYRAALKLEWGPQGKKRLDSLASRLDKYRDQLKTIMQISILKRMHITQTQVEGIDRTAQRILQESQNSRSISDEQFRVLLSHVRTPKPVYSGIDPDAALIRSAFKGDAKSLLDLLLRGNAYIEATDRGQCTAIMRASEHGHLEAVDCLIAQGANIEAQDEGGRRALMIAAAAGHLSVVSHLLDKNARIDPVERRTMHTALVKALLNEHWEIADLLNHRGRRNGIIDPALLGLFFRAAKSGQSKIISWLIEAGIDIDEQQSDGSSALMTASHNGCISVVVVLLNAKACTETRDDGGFTALNHAAMKGHSVIVSALLDAGANPNAMNKWGWSCLAEVANYGWHSMIDPLVSKGAYLETRDDGRYTPLCKAAQRSRTTEVGSLLKHGANTAAQNRDGWTALAEASFHGRAEIVRSLLEKGASTEISGQIFERTGERGWTPLMRAAHRGHLEVVKLLADAGANLNARTTEGRTALQIIENRKDRVYEYLQQAGAK